MFLAGLIYIVHVIVILFVVIAPFLNIPGLLTLHIVYTICLMTHWYFNNNICCLTVAEGYLRGIKPSETFIHEFIKPMYDINENVLNKYIWIITIIMFLISSYKLYNYINSIDNLTIKHFFIPHAIKKIELKQ